MPNLITRIKLSKVFIFFLLILLPFVLTGCSLLGTKTTQPVTLKYWGIWESPTTINEVIADYKKIKPDVTIIYEKRSPQQYRESLQSQIASGKGPDVFTFHNTWAPMLSGELAPAPQSVVTDRTLSQDYYPTTLSDMRNKEKKVIGLPTGIDGLALFYNVDIFQAAGIINPPATWNELAQIASQITVKDQFGNIKTAGVALGTAANIDHFSDIIGLMMLQNGGDPGNPADKAVVDALEYYINFAKRDNKVWDETLPASTVSFTGGNLAMYLAPSWRAIEIKNANPLLNFKVAPAPQLEGGQVNWASYWANGVSSKSSNTKEAWEFVKYMNEEQTLTKIYSEATKSPGRFFGQPFPKVSMGSKLSSDPIVGSYIFEAPTMRSFPMASRTYDNGPNDQIIKAYQEAIDSANQGALLSQTLEAASQNISAALTKYGYK